MTMTTREAFERGTDTFNAHDVDGFAQVLADDVVSTAPGGMRGKGKDACLEFYAGWFGAFSDAHVEVEDVQISGDVAVEEGTFTGVHDGVLRAYGMSHRDIRSADTAAFHVKRHLSARAGQWDSEPRDAAQKNPPHPASLRNQRHCG